MTLSTALQPYGTEPPHSRMERAESINYIDSPLGVLDRLPANKHAEESKHFLSLQLFSKHAEPPLHEFFAEQTQVELELKQREEEDGLYRRFLQERKEKEAEVLNMEEEERNLLFADMNRKERSRIINLAERHCTQMMDMIYREKVKYLEEGGEEISEIMAKYPRNPPVHMPPKYLKEQVYEKNEAVFETVDLTAKAMAKEEFDSLTGAVRCLTGKCYSEVDKARAIFRFITEKEFEYKCWFLYYPEQGNNRGSPTSLFRAVEFGIESKAWLFKRLCAYAGLHACVIQGFAKAKEYRPGEEFVDNRWRGSWNAIYVADGWRLVHPNWASLQVNTKALRETRKEYQDHYFLTNPDEFIFEFFPLSAEFQFLEHPITKSEFENLPVLRSTFFHFGLSLSRSESLLSAVLHTDEETGEANIYLRTKKNVCYHYSLTNYKTGSTCAKVNGEIIPLDRFVMLSIHEEEATFNIHVPNKGEYMLEIGCAESPAIAEYLSAPIPYINVCKFKIICKKVRKTMVALPDCVPGEWGPHKAFKLFGLKGVSHPLPIIYAAPPSTVDMRTEVRPLTLNIEFEKTTPVLDFVTKLYKNGVEEKQLKQAARYRNKENYVIFDIKVPHDGQYGLDIYTRRNWEEKMVHCCKYLINCDV